LVFLALLVFLNWGPYQAFAHDADKSGLVWTWRLYTNSGRDICDLAYFTRDADGLDTAVARWELLGASRPGELPDEQARIFRRQVRAQHRSVCAKLRARTEAPVDLRADVRCGKDGGWEQIERRERNLCEGSR
jgi:hypothetical protein